MIRQRIVKLGYVTLALLACASSTATLSATANVSITISPGDLNNALEALLHQTDLVLLYESDAVKGKHTNGVKNAHSAQAALHQILRGTLFDFRIDPNHQAYLVPAESPHGGHLATPAIAASKVRPQMSDPDPSRVVEIISSWSGQGTLTGAEIISLTRGDIETAGTPSVADFLMTLPQTFGGGPNQDTHIGTEAQSNSGLGVGVNLRGLGARATLVLIDGKRVAPSGSNAEFADDLNIPMMAVERIEVVPNGGGAWYGADGAGGIVNFVLRDRYNGAETHIDAGSGTRGDLARYRVGQLFGTDWGTGHGVLSLEYYFRGGLPAQDRLYANSDLNPWNGTNSDTLFSNPGNILAGNLIWAIPAGQNGQHLAASRLTPGTANLQNQYAGAQIIPEQQRWSLFGSGNQQLTDRVTLFTDVLLTKRNATEAHGGQAMTLAVPASNPFYVNPAGGNAPVLVDYNFLQDLGAVDARVDVDTVNVTSGLDFDIGHSWSMQAYVHSSRERERHIEYGSVNPIALQSALADSNPLAAFNPFGAGSNTNADTLNTIRDNNRFTSDSELGVLDVTADGPLATLPAGVMKLSLGIDRRQELFATEQTLSASDFPNQYSGRRTVLGVFGECNIPLFSEKNAVVGIQDLQLSLAARYEHYSDSAGSGIPTSGVVWSPLRSLRLRGTWAHQVRPPSLGDRDTARNEIFPVLLPNAATSGNLTTLVLTGNNPLAGDEHATIQTVGLDFTPQQIQGMALSATYFETVFKNRLQSTLLTENVLNDRRYAALVLHNPTAAQLTEVCRSGAYEAGTTESCENSGVGAVIDLRTRNLATAVTRGVDFGATYEHVLGPGKLDLGLSGTWILQFDQADTPSEALVSYLDTQNNPVDIRLRASAVWKVRNLRILTAANFTNSYRDIGSIPERRVNSWTTIDMELRYEFSDSSDSWLGRMSVALDAVNVFDVDPPFLNNQIVGIGYDQENANPFGRILSLQLDVKW